MTAVYSGAIPDLDALYYADPLGSTHYLGFMAEVQAALDALGINPQGSSGTVAARMSAIETKLAQSALLATTVDSSPAISNSTTETAFNTAQYTVPGLTAVVGRTYRVTASGKMSTLGPSPGLLSVNLRWGNAAGNPLLVGFQGIVVPAGITNVGWYANMVFTIRTIGASGTAMGSGIGVVVASGPWGPTATQVVINTTNDTILTLFAAWTVASASNSITLQNFIVERIN